MKTLLILRHNHPMHLHFASMDDREKLGYPFSKVQLLDNFFCDRKYQRLPCDDAFNIHRKLSPSTSKTQIPLTAYVTCREKLNPFSNKGKSRH